MDLNDRICDELIKINICVDQIIKDIIIPPHKCIHAAIDTITRYYKVLEMIRRNSLVRPEVMEKVIVCHDLLLRVLGGITVFLLQFSEINLLQQGISDIVTLLEN